MLNVQFTAQFKRDFKLCKRRGLDEEKLRVTIDLLKSEISLPERYNDHALVNSKNYRDARECHIEPDWLLVYKIYQNMLILELLRTGTHSDLY